MALIGMAMVCKAVSNSCKGGTGRVRHSLYKEPSKSEKVIGTIFRVLVVFILSVLWCAIHSAWIFFIATLICVIANVPSNIAVCIMFAVIVASLIRSIICIVLNIRDCV